MSRIRAGLEPIERGLQWHQIFGRVRADTSVPVNRHGVRKSRQLKGKRATAELTARPRAQTTAGFSPRVSSRTEENPARSRAAAISRPLATDVSSVAPGPRG